MFDFAWSEIALIGVVALVAIGPKDMPVAIRTIAQMIKKARRMAGEFQTHVDEMMREANLDEVRQQFNDIRNFDIKGQIEKAVDADGSLRQTFASNPLAPTAPEPVWSPPAGDVALPETAVAETAAHVIAAPEGVDLLPSPEGAAAEPPAFVPPELAARAAAPAFVPPAIARS